MASASTKLAPYACPLSRSPSFCDVLFLLPPLITPHAPSQPIRLGLSLHPIKMCLRKFELLRRRSASALAGRIYKPKQAIAASFDHPK